MTDSIERFPLGAPLIDVPAFRFDLESIAFQYSRDFAATIAEPEARRRYLEAFGGDFAYKRLLRVPGLRASFNEVPPGASVPPHRHGANQVTYVVKGALRYGARTARAGMGQVNPRRFYSWTAGEEGASFLEVHDTGEQMTIFPRDPVPAGAAPEDRSPAMNPFIYDTRGDVLRTERVVVNEIARLPTLRVAHCILAAGEQLPASEQTDGGALCLVLGGGVHSLGEAAGASSGYYWPQPAAASAGAEGADFMLFSARQEGAASEKLRRR